MNQIIIIGTQPPCSRCKLVTNIISSKVKDFNIRAEIKHLSFTDQYAIDFAKKLGLEAGTAKAVAKKMKVEINHDQLNELLQHVKPNPNSEFAPYNDCGWTIELDNFLRDYEFKAKELGILMTPVLIINGEVKHSGSVPKIENIEKWLNELI